MGMVGAYAPIIDRIEELARARGLSFEPVYFRLTDSDELAEVASMGLPNRFIHWYWGGAYKELTTQQNKEAFSILELVLNTRPSHAFLRASNTYLQNVLVIAHVVGHVDFFALIQRTHIINEGWATFVEADLLREILDPREWITISVQLSSRPAPYTIGYSLFKAIKDGRGFDAALEVRTYYEDVMLIQEALSEEMIRRLDIFVYDPKEKKKSYDVQRVRDMLIEQKQFKGQPHVEVELGANHRDLTLVHKDEERKLEPKRISLFLKAVHSLWRNPVRLRANGKVYTYARRGLSST